MTWNGHSEAELVQLALDILDDGGFEDLTLLENLLHCHTADNDTRLALDDTFDDVLDMITAGAGGFLLGGVGGSAGQDLGVLAQRFVIVIGTDGEDGGEGELELLHGHGLQRDFEVKGADGDSAGFLPWPDPGLFDNLNILYSTASDDQVGVGVGDVVAHGDGGDPRRLQPISVNALQPVRTNGERDRNRDRKMESKVE